MANLNKVFLMGNLTRDPELRYTPSGLGIASFSLAVNTPIGKDKENEVLFIDVVSFGKQAEIIAEYLKKGSPVFIEGRLRFRSWEDNNGNKRSKHEIVLNSFQFLSSKTKSADAAGSDIAAPAEDEDIPF